MSQQSLDVFLAPDYEALQNLDASLAALRNIPPNAQTTDHAFQVATILLSHARRDQIIEGLDIMERLASRCLDELRFLPMVDNRRRAEELNQNQQQQQEPDSLTAIEAERAKARETLLFAFFLLGVGQYKLGEYAAARSSVERMLELHPHHPQGVALRDRIDEDVLKKAAWGVAAAAAAALGVAALFRRISSV
jgi:hypothetical protein